MGASTHIIINGSFSKNGNLIGRDSNFNKVFIPQQVIKSANLNSLDKIQYPLYSISTVETYNRLDGKPGDSERNLIKDIDGNAMKFKRLTAFAIFQSIDKLFQAYTESISLSTALTQSNFESKEVLTNMEYLQNSVATYFAYLKKAIYDVDNSSFTELMNLQNQVVRNEIEILIPNFNCADITTKLLFSGINIKNISDDEWQEYLAYSYESFPAERKENCIILDELHLYTESRKASTQLYAKNRILSFDDFMNINFNQNWNAYISQYYFLKSLQLVTEDENLYLDNFELERFPDFIERCKEKFDDYKLYRITPLICEDSTPEAFNVIHNEIISICEKLKSHNITNFIIMPPLNDLNYRLHMQDEIPYDSENSDRNYNIIDEASADEMRRMDEETDGFWRIANDLD